jgi:hypothetical protein
MAKMAPDYNIGVLGGPGTGGFSGSLFVPDKSRKKSEQQTQAEWQKLVASANKRRAEGFLGQVVLPGEGNYEDWKQLNQYEMMRNPDAPDSLYDDFLKTVTSVSPDDQPLDYYLPGAYPPGDNRREVNPKYTGGQKNVMENLGDYTYLDKQNRTGSTGMVDIVSEMENAAAGNTTNMPTVTPTFVAETPGTIMDTTGKTVGAAPTAGTATADTSGLATTAPGAPGAGVGQIAGIQDVTTGLQDLGPMAGATLTPTGPYVDMTGVQAGPSAGAIATAATDQLDPRATTQYQLGQIMASLQSGAPMPPWAAPAVRKIGSIMQARGLGASSMASAAMTQALMESGVQIAQQDANKYATIQLANLNNKQQTALANAATFAAMDKANLNARMTAAVTNAQAFLSVDLKNLDNEQKAGTLTYNALVQGLFKDAAEENARKQFNAKNELQVEEFFAELGAQVDTANANRVAAMRQFNTSETNAMSQFNANLKDSRQKFNASMRFAVDQSNVVWRREINSANTAIQNETNRMNVQNQYNMTMTAMNNLWQEYRDDAAWNFQKSESALARQHDLARIAFNYANAEKLYDQEQQDKLLEKIGEWLQNL